MEEDRSCGEVLLEGREGGLGRRCPDEGTLRGGEVSKGSSYAAVVPNETAIEVCKS